MNFIIIFIIIGFALTLLQKAIVLNVSGVQWTRKRLILTTLVIYLPHTILFTFVIRDHIFGWISVVSGLALFILAYHISFKQSLFKSAFMSIGQYFVLGAGFNYTFAFLVNQLPCVIRFFLWENTFILRVFVVLIYALIFIYTQKYIDKGYTTLNHMVTKHWPFYLAFFLFFAAYDAIHMFDVAGFQYVDSLTEFFAVLLFIGFFIHSLWHVRTDNRLETSQLELNIQQLYANAQDKIIYDLRLSQHNFNGIISMMHELLSKGKVAEVTALIETISQPVAESIETPEVIKKHPILKGFLAEKMVRASIKGVNFEIEIMDKNINLGYCSEIDYNRMTSIFLDNAIEAAALSKRKFVKLKISHEEGGAPKTQIINSYDGEIELHRISKKGYSTKPNHAGEGLYHFNLYFQKYAEMGYSILLCTSFKNGYFIQEFTL